VNAPAREAGSLTDHDALAVAEELAVEFARGAGDRDAGRLLPHDEVDALKRSGLLALSVPARFGGPDLPATVVAEVFRIIANADPSLAQIPHSHYTFLEALRAQGSPSQQGFFFGLVRDGALFANAQTERGPHPVNVDGTTLASDDAGGFVLSGRKFYATGSWFADWLIVRASLAEKGQTPDASTPKALAFIPRDAAGVEVVDDWDGLGQRTTASGTVTLDAVRVPAEHVVPFSPIFDGPSTYGAHAQLLHTAIDVGIATGALAAVRAALLASSTLFDLGGTRSASA
jgi:alkylation response protein AidB-like acyl-CoA dehydrogenase